jgi:hypothetical protein
MANAFLNQGATSLAAANWSDAAGFADGATLFIQSGTQDVTGGLSPTYDGVTGLTNLDVLPAFSGRIGGTAGSLAAETKISVLNQTTQLPRVRYWGNGGAFYYTAQGTGTSVNACVYLQFAGSGLSVVNGTCTVYRLEVESGPYYVGASVDGVTTYRWTLAGGSGTIDGIVGSNELFSVTVTGGSHTVKRGVVGGTVAENSTKEGLNVYGGVVTIDAFAETISDMTIAGGTVIVRNCGTITYVGGFSGVLDLSQLQRPLTITTLTDAQTLTIVPPPPGLLTITNRYKIGHGSAGLT